MQLDTIWVSNIPFDATQSQVCTYLAQAGTIKTFRFVTDRRTGNHKGQAFCTYKHPQFAESAVRNLNKKEFHGRILNIVLNTVSDDFSSKNWKLEEIDTSWQILPIDIEILTFINNLTNSFKIKLVKEFVLLAKQEPKALTHFLRTNEILTQVLLCILQKFRLVKEEDKQKLMNDLKGKTKEELNKYICILNVPSYVTQNQLTLVIEKLWPGVGNRVRMIYSMVNLKATGKAVIRFDSSNEAIKFRKKYRTIIVDDAVLNIELARELVEPVREVKDQGAEENEDGGFAVDGIEGKKENVVERLQRVLEKIEDIELKKEIRESIDKIKEM